MSEYFRRYIKKEHYPVQPYHLKNIEPILNLKLHSEIVFMMAWPIDSGSKHGMMIGILSGARRNR